MIRDLIVLRDAPKMAEQKVETNRLSHSRWGRAWILAETDIRRGLSTRDRHGNRVNLMKRMLRFTPKIGTRKITFCVKKMKPYWKCHIFTSACFHF